MALTWWCVLVGTLPMELADWEMLELVHVGGNNLSGPLPDWPNGTWNKVKYVDINHNNFSGKPWLCTCTAQPQFIASEWGSLEAISRCESAVLCTSPQLAVQTVLAMLCAFKQFVDLTQCFQLGSSISACLLPAWPGSPSAV